MSRNSRNKPVVGIVRRVANLGLAMPIILAVNGAEPAEPTEADKQPNPVDLLKTVAQAREKIASGEIEFEVVRFDFGHPLEGTNHVRLKVVFDGEKRRFESFSREYRSVLMDPMPPR